MAVKSSGALSLTTDIVGEFGGVAPHSLSEYYGGGPYVPAGANPGIATSGQINMGSHYNAVAATVLTISSNVNNYDIGAQAIAAGGDKSTPVILTINSGVTVGSTSTSTAAMYTGTGWSNGTTINITNNGSIVGASGSNTTGSGGTGGTGGRGGSGNYSCGGTYYSSAGSAGSSGSGSAASAANGGNAFEHSQTADNNLSVIFDTLGTRIGGSAGTTTFQGGGGGGGGGSHRAISVSEQGWYYYGGGGGGGGASSGSGNVGGRGAIPNNYGQIWCNSGYNGASGSGGGSTTGGSGGSGAGSAGNGGNGGSLGNNGGSGSSATYGGSSGGASGSTGYATGSSGSALSGNTGQIS